MNDAPSAQTDIDKLEKELNVQLPNNYKKARFAIRMGCRIGLRVVRQARATSK